MTTVGYGTSATSISGSGESLICPGPVSGQTRTVTGVFVFNEDTIPHQFSIYCITTDSTIVKVISSASLNPGESMRLEDSFTVIPINFGGNLYLSLDVNTSTNPISVTTIYTDVIL